MMNRTVARAGTENVVLRFCASMGSLSDRTCAEFLRRTMNPATDQTSLTLCYFTLGTLRAFDFLSSNGKWMHLCEGLLYYP